MTKSGEYMKMRKKQSRPNENKEEIHKTGKVRICTFENVRDKSQNQVQIQAEISKTKSMPWKPSNQDIYAI